MHELGYGTGAGLALWRQALRTEVMLTTHGPEVGG
jgi:hypothetical protein